MRLPVLPTVLSVLLSAVASAASASGPAADPQTAFWAALQQHCGKAYRGRLVDPQPADAELATQTLVMHIRDCSADAIRIPFHVGNNRSRTWVLTRTASGLRLKHDHRHEDGSEDRITQYGGDTADAGSASAQRFHADALTAALIPAAKDNIWTVGIDTTQFSYMLTRASTGRRFRAEFDLQNPVDLPPPAWGAH